MLQMIYFLVKTLHILILIAEVHAQSTPRDGLQYQITSVNSLRDLPCAISLWEILFSSPLKMSSMQSEESAARYGNMTRLWSGYDILGENLLCTDS